MGCAEKGSLKIPQRFWIETRLKRNLGFNRIGYFLTPQWMRQNRDPALLAGSRQFAA
jgi:hypothetical protein